MYLLADAVKHRDNTRACVTTANGLPVGARRTHDRYLHSVVTVLARSLCGCRPSTQAGMSAARAGLRCSVDSWMPGRPSTAAPLTAGPLSDTGTPASRHRVEGSDQRSRADTCSTSTLDQSQCMYACMHACMHVCMRAIGECGGASGAAHSSVHRLPPVLGTPHALR
jgi:hypothetical protein